MVDVRDQFRCAIFRLAEMLTALSEDVVDAAPDGACGNIGRLSHADC